MSISLFRTLAIALMMTCVAAGCKYRQPDSPTRQVNNSLLLTTGLKEIIAHRDLSDAEFTAKSFGLTIQRIQGAYSIDYTIIGAPPEIFKSPSEYSTSFDEKIGTRFIIFVDEKNYCITPEFLQNSLGNLRTATRFRKAKPTDGIILEPEDEPAKLAIFMEFGSGCLSRIEVYQRAEPPQ